MGCSLGEREVASLNDDECFAITEHLNHARSLIDPGDESETLVQLNLRSARQAKAASVWEVAVAFAQQALDRLPEEGWQTHSAECKSLYQIKAGVVLFGRAARGPLHCDYEVVFKHPEDDLQRARFARPARCRRLVVATGCQGCSSDFKGWLI
ncbi:MAG: hypothetical protein IPM37_22315 [Hahellaceae bacterium]|nr:hypothetical protein [Hahellaceae bacterium]